MNVSKISDITADDLVEYLRIPDADATDKATLNTLKGVAVEYIAQYTGRTREQLDLIQDLVIVAMILVEDMWDNRSNYVDNNNVNKVVESILNLHVVNLL